MVNLSPHPQLFHLRSGLFSTGKYRIFLAILLMDTKIKFRGVCWGLRSGAVGTTLEFKLPASFKPIEQRQTRSWRCPGTSLWKRMGSIPKDQMDRLCRW
jgi:hypothetical protein